MTKREMIDDIMKINLSAQPEFLADFDDIELEEYLHHLKWVDQPTLSGDASRYARYFSGDARNQPHWNTLQQCKTAETHPATIAM